MQTNLSDRYQWAVERNIPIASTDTLRIIETILKERKPVYCIEFGTAIGRSTVHIARTLAPWEGRLISFEISYPSYHKARTILADEWITNAALYHHNIDTVDLDAHLYRRVDFAFIDAHKESYSNYFLRLLPYLDDQAVILFDDVEQYASKVDGLEDLLKAHWLTFRYYASDNNTDSVLVATMAKK